MTTLDTVAITPEPLSTGSAPLAKKRTRRTPSQMAKARADKAERIASRPQTGESRAEGRPIRIPISQRKVLQAKQRDGFVRRYVNEVMGRVEMFFDAGWRIVNKDQNTRDKNAHSESQLGSVDRIAVNRDPKMRATTAVLMEIEQHLYDEDAAYKQAQIAAQEKVLSKPETVKNLYGKGVTHETLRST